MDREYTRTHTSDITDIRKGLSRRSLLKAAALMPFVDQAWGEFVWSGTNPQIEWYMPPMEGNHYRHTATIILPGYGNNAPQRIAGALKPVLQEYGAIAHMTYSDDGLQIDDIKRHTRAFIKENGLKTVYLYGHSMGGMVATEIAADLHSRGAAFVRGIVLDCTPSTVEDVRGRRADIGINLLRWTGEAHVHAGPMARFTFEALSRMVQRDFRLSDIGKDSFEKASGEGCSNALLQSQLGYLAQFRPDEFTQQLQDTAFIHLGPEQDMFDRVVSNNKARANWQRLLGDRVLFVTGNTRHANPYHRKEEYQSMLRHGMEQWWPMPGSNI